MRAAPGRRAEALVEQLDERRDAALELLGEPHEPCKIRLPRLLALAELLRRPLEPPLRERRRAHRRTCFVRLARQRLQQPPRRVAREKGGALERDPRLVQL